MRTRFEIFKFCEGTFYPSDVFDGTSHKIKVAVRAGLKEALQSAKVKKPRGRGGGALKKARVADGAR